MKATLLAVALLVFAWPALADTMPPYLEPFQSEYGYTVVRVTDPGEPIMGLGAVWGEIARHHYSVDPAWSANSEYLAISKGDPSGTVYLDGRTFEPLFIANPPDSDRWHPTMPGVQIWAEGDQAGWYVPATDTTIVKRTFSGYSGLSIGPSKGRPSNDGNRIALAAIDPTGNEVVFAYDFAADAKYPDIPKSTGSATISPNGDLIVMGGEWTGGTTYQTKIFDIQGNEIQFFDEGHRPGHADVIVDAYGEQWLVGRSKSAPDAYDTIKRSLTTGEVVSLITDGDGAGHTSARDLSGDGMVYLSFSDGTSSPYADTVAMLNIDTAEFTQLATIHRFNEGYLSEAHGCPSPDGSMLIFASNWGDTANGIAAYVAFIPEPPTLVMLLIAGICMLGFSRIRTRKRGARR
jgi:hypothetical protein